MDPYTTTINTIDIFEFTVIPSANIPTGVIPSTTTDTHSYI